MGHYDALRQAMADKQREEEIEREARWERVNPHDKLIEEIRNEMLELKEEIADIKSFVDQLRIVYEDE